MSSLWGDVDYTKKELKRMKRANFWFWFREDIRDWGPFCILVFVVVMGILFIPVWIEWFK